jgi:UDP-2,3-diacylglucosamine pyrophosphatase LpxH
VKTNVREERLLIVSDLHLGNALVRSGRRFRKLLAYALEHRYSVCVNGDCVDMMHLSMHRLTHDLWECYDAIKKFSEEGLRLYVTVGNHDIVLEHFLQDWSGLVVAPFLNVESGDKRVRIEHGHMYDKLYLQYPLLYIILTTLGRWIMHLSPIAYTRVSRIVFWLASAQERADALIGRRYRELARRGIPGEPTWFSVAAEEVSQRGFDAVVFGHTHIAGQATLPGGVRYFNTGVWMMEPWCVALDHGKITFGRVQDLVSKPKWDTDTIRAWVPTAKS